MEEKNLTVETLAKDVIDQAKHQAKMWFIAFIVTLAALIATNAYWIYVFQSYEYIAQDGNGINNYKTTNSGDIVNGTED